MSADGKNCECGRKAFAQLRRRDERTPEPICSECVKQIAPGFVQTWPIDTAQAEAARG